MNVDARELPALEPLFHPLKVGSIEVRNRVVLGAHLTQYNYDGRATQRWTDYLTLRARSGVGMIVTECCAVREDGLKGLQALRMWEEEAIPGLARATASVHEEGAKIFCQLGHPGSMILPYAAIQAPVAPSSIFDPAFGTAHELGVSEINDLVRSFGLCASHAMRAGFDGIELHLAHGDLMQQFLSPATNRRVDAYGGALDNRLRFVREIVACIRSQIGAAGVIGVRINIREERLGGYDHMEGERACVVLAGDGVDYLSITAGGPASPARPGGSITTIPPMGSPLTPLREYSAQIKRLVSVPVVVSHRIRDLDTAARLIGEGSADLVSMVRAHIADGQIIAKTLRGEAGRVRWCIGCLEGCIGRNGVLTCLVNPAVGKDEGSSMPSASPRRKVAVVGGGVAGMQIAIDLDLRGHAVRLFERNSFLGGALRAAANLPDREELLDIVRWQTSELALRDLPIHLGTEFDPSDAKDFDVVVLATGARERSPQSQFPCDARVLNVSEHQSRPVTAGDRILIVDRSDYYNLALLLAIDIVRKGGFAHIVSVGLPVASKLEPQNKGPLMLNPAMKDVLLTSSGRVIKVTNHVATIIQDKHEWTAPVDEVLLIDSRVSENSLETKIRSASPKCEVLTIGDAFAPRSALEAMHDAHALGLRI
jgi:2,4-dienoyl-CoA reductase-like NADH-dependent reductase (Old Yellow Enzyme family)